MNNTPLAYIITFTTYGTWLHGDERGSINEPHGDYIAKKGTQGNLSGKMARQNDRIA